jgi:hypothetical protein
VTGRVRAKFLAAISPPEIIKATRSRMVIGGGGGNRTAGTSPGSDDSRAVSRTGIDRNTFKEHEQNALPDILMTMSQIPVPDVTQELADVWALHALFAAAQRNEE